MASRPVWEGHLRLSLVTCPVSLHKAAGEARGAVRFHLLNPETHNRVKQAWKDPGDGEVARRDLVRGYEIEKDTYVVIEDEDLKALRLESTKVIDIGKFVEAGAIDRLYWDEPYYLVPDGKAAAEPYAVIREAMAGEDRVALGRLVMAGRERAVAIEVRDRGMLLTTLRSQDEVRDGSELLDAVPDVRISRDMIEIAKRIIAQAEGEFDPEEFDDRYQAALRDLVERKAAGAKVSARPTPEPAATNVIDLMDALRRSLKRGAASGEDGAARAEETRKAQRPAARGRDEGDKRAGGAPAPPQRRRQGGSRGASPRRRASGGA
jgi:DNA end-binding protein Ku